MGIILSLFKSPRRDDPAAAPLVASPLLELLTSVTLPEPTPAETGTLSRLPPILAERTRILQELRAYTGNTDLVRDAISNGKDEERFELAWNAVQPSVSILGDAYKLSEALPAALSLLLSHLTSTRSTPGSQAMLENPNITRYLLSVFSWAVEFDMLKLNRPQLQNDFSFYRRSLSRSPPQTASSTTPSISTMKQTLEQDQLADTLALWSGQSYIMLNTLIRACEECGRSGSGMGQQVVGVLRECANGCMTAVDGTMKGNYELSSALVASIILYDNTDSQGAFHRSSPINTRQAARILQTSSSTERSAELLGALTSNVRHLNDEGTSKAVKAVFGKA